MFDEVADAVDLMALKYDVISIDGRRPCIRWQMKRKIPRSTRRINKQFIRRQRESFYVKEKNNRDDVHRVSDV